MVERKRRANRKIESLRGSIAEMLAVPKIKMAKKDDNDFILEQEEDFAYRTQQSATLERLLAPLDISLPSTSLATGGLVNDGSHALINNAVEALVSDRASIQSYIEPEQIDTRRGLSGSRETLTTDAFNHRNDLWRNMHVRITEPMPCYNVGFYSLILSSADVARNLYTYVQDLVLHTVPIESNCMPTASEAGSIRLSSETVQDIMNQLWMMGFRPIERVREDDAEARALRSEIEYLRNLVQSLTQADRASGSVF